jgi:glyoxylate/hydroxypyruvate reductase A
MTMTLLLAPLPRQNSDWHGWFKAEMPELDLRLWPDAGERKDIDVIAIGRFPSGELGGFPNLKLIIALQAGTERLLADPSLPRNVPVVRVGDPDGDAMMTETALLHVLRHHRDLPAYQLAQQRGEWLSLPLRRPNERRVGVMGLGPIGLAVAKTLADYGFDVAAWVRSPREVDNVEVFHGRDRLPAFLERSEIVVNLLPLTDETQGILCGKTFAQLPKGASIINLGRGGHVVDADLISTLDSGHLAAATLDVFHVEPLPQENPLWRHPRITITPHCARRIDARDLVPRICGAVRRFRAGQPLEQLVDRVRGY